MFSRKKVDELSTNLSSVQRSMLWRCLTRDKPDSNSAVTPGEALVIWLADLLAWVKVCDQDQQRLLIEEFLLTIKAHGDKVAESLVAEDDLPIAYLGFGDRSLVTMTGCAEALDLNSCGRVKVLPGQLLETINYNLTTLYVRKHSAVARKDSGRKHGKRNATSRS